VEEEYHGMDWYEYAAPTEAKAIDFVAELKAKGYDVEQPFHSTAGTDGRFSAENGFGGNKEMWTITVYIDQDFVSAEVVAAMDTIAETHDVESWGCEPSTSYEHGERDGSVNAHL